MPIEFEGVRTREIFMDESAFTRPQFNAEHKNSDLLDPQSWEKSWKNRLAVLDHNASVWSATPTQHNAKILENADEDIEESFSIPSFDQESALTGQLCHLALKKWDFKNPMGVEKLLTQESGVLSLTHPSPHWNKILHESATLLKRFLSSQTAVEISQKEILGREIPFAYEENGTVVRGVMDIVYRDHGKIVIADYKTGPPPPGNSPSPMQRYQEQAAIYCHAIEKFFGVKNVEFRIIFLRAPEKLIRWYNEKAFWELNPGLGI